MVHAENSGAIRFLTDRLERAGKTAPHFHGGIAAYPGRARGDAPCDLARRTRRCAAGDCPRLRMRKRWRKSRAPNAGPQGLWRDLPAISRADCQGHGRPQHGGHQICLLAAATRQSEPESVLGGTTAAAFSRSTPPITARSATTRTGKLTSKGRTSFRWVPNGIPGVETRLPILFSEGVGKGRLSLNDFVALSATNHARTYGLYPKKAPSRLAATQTSRYGIEQARDDLPEISCTTARTTHRTKASTLPAGQCRPMVRGTFIVRDGELTGVKGTGNYVSREKSPLAVPLGRAVEI